MWTLAQAGEQWWDLVPAQIVLWASALAAVLYIFKRLFGGAEFIRRLALFALQIGITQEWPNGSTDLASSLKVIYDKSLENNRLIRDLRKEVHEHANDSTLHA